MKGDEGRIDLTHERMRRHPIERREHKGVGIDGRVRAAVRVREEVAALALLNDSQSLAWIRKNGRGRRDRWDRSKRIGTNRKESHLLNDVEASRVLCELEQPLLDQVGLQRGRGAANEKGRLPSALEKHGEQSSKAI